MNSDSEKLNLKSHDSICSSIFAEEETSEEKNLLNNNEHLHYGFKASFIF
jgi:hypothetical protein